MITVSQLLAHLPTKLFDDLTAEFQVDRHNHKLTGKTMFQLLAYALLEQDKISLRTIEQSFSTHQYQILYKGAPLKASKSGIADRLRGINFLFFEAIFENLVARISKLLPKTSKHDLKIFDSTAITLSSLLLQCGFPVPRGSKNQIKFSIGFSNIPETVRFGCDKSSMSEDIALRDVIKTASLSDQDIAVFDRGLASRKTFKEFSQEKIQFVTRLNDKANYRVISTHQVIEKTTAGQLQLLSDEIVNLRSKNEHWVDAEFRLIRAICQQTNKSFFFLTNIFFLSAEEIAEIYKQRWNIEVFFKFIKQHLQAKHFLSRSLNGIKVVFYTILSVSILLTAFKILNNIENYKSAKLHFIEQLKRALTYQIILFYQHDPSKFYDSFIF
ncbi:MAG: IS4 family transposase [Bacteroidota bacterium]|nr:IS4 family transposase [Bacteroidota bacterium]